MPSGCERRRRKKERLAREQADLNIARTRIAGFIHAIANGASIERKQDGPPASHTNDDDNEPGTIHHAGQASADHASQDRGMEGNGSRRAGGKVGSGGTQDATRPEDWSPPEIRTLRHEGRRRGESGLTLTEEAKLNARAVLDGWVQTEFPIHRTAEDLLKDKRTRGHLTIAEELTVALAVAAKTVPNLAPMAARAGAAMALTNAKIMEAKARAQAMIMAATADGDTEAALDIAEAALLATGLAGDRHALETYLKARGRGRGYVDRQERLNANLNMTSEEAAEVLARIGLNATAGSISDRIEAMPDAPEILVSDNTAAGARAPRRYTDEDD